MDIVDKLAEASFELLNYVKTNVISAEVSCQIVYGDIDRVFHIEENIRKMKDAELEAALKEDYADDDTTEE